MLYLVVAGLQNELANTVLSKSQRIAFNIRQYGIRVRVPVHAPALAHVNNALVRVNNFSIQRHPTQIISHQHVIPRVCACFLCRSLVRPKCSHAAAGR
jgi:hypothetical protein